MESLAREVREKYADKLVKVNLTSLKAIYKAEGLELEYRSINSARIRAMYFCDEVGCTVMVKKELRMEQKLFSMAHELKHHLADRDDIEAGTYFCGDYHANARVEVGAEVFAAELIYPRSEVIREWSSFGLSAQCSAEDIVRFKVRFGRPISYRTLLKRLELCKLVVTSRFDGTKFKVLEDKLFPPFYKDPSFKLRRAARAKKIY